MSAVVVVTLNRQAVTLPPSMDAPEAKDPSAAILSEIAERLEELDALKLGLAADVVLRLALLAQKSQRAFRITIQLMHGNLAPILASYEDQARSRHVTKQDIHYEFRHEVEAIKPFFPELYRVIVAMRAQATQHEDPVAKGEVARAHGAD